MAEASGLRQSTCPWWALRDPYVQAVLRAHRWWVKGAVIWSDLPLAVAHGIEVFDGALNAVISHDQRAELEEQRRRSAEQSGQSWGPPGATRPRHRRR